MTVTLNDTAAGLSSSAGVSDADLFGAASGWIDIIGQISTPSSNPAKPAYGPINATAFEGWNFEVNDQVQINYHIPHGLKPGAGVFFHVHFIMDGTNTNPVKFEFNFTSAKGHGQAAFNLTGTTVNVTQSIDGTQYKHYVTEVSAEQLAGSIEPDAIVMCIVKRVTNGATDNTDACFVLTTDCHLQVDRLSTLNRTPNFYA